MSATADPILEHPSVRRVREALRNLGAGDRVIVLSDSARTAQQAADALGCPVGAIVKSLVFAHEGKPVMALVAGDRQCDLAALGQALGLGGTPKRADADLVRQATGFAIGGVSPLGHLERLPIAVDASLKRFETLHAAAGHPHAVFPLSYRELLDWTGGKEAVGISQG
ncbi:YbaK/EbsC family protein [uncultured Ferrovibrio sp.]|jgi:prolyl-tRNA editing enzyme YbaK/EbsC (Cys-tRNA(Pro) deacylase)|uniref:YbaK/EbsC family protein n=1 Tax=uncultured Ferrovibrio sp. TaxID=1576913 RepID=UPI00262D9EE1|nr:YbaK/EbsC family protein [uncultured Ferrovibrio sp.]